MTGVPAGGFPHQPGHTPASSSPPGTNRSLKIKTFFGQDAVARHNKAETRADEAAQEREHTFTR
jgi:hypothetical protein